VGWDSTGEEASGHHLKLASIAANAVNAVNEHNSMAASPQPLRLPSVEGDTSICSHLRTLVQRQPDVERRFVDVVRWGALDQGAKRRKVSDPGAA
jgi:hypothetical protein